MAIILNIDCATQNASVGFSNDNLILCSRQSSEQKDHAAFLQAALKEMVVESGISLQQLSAVAVVAGPGSYTGLRVGMASAKGLCYALNIPLLLLNTLEVMTAGALRHLPQEKNNDNGTVFCPMIDARRMEVFTAIYDNNFKTLMPPSAIEITPGAFDKYTQQNRIIFFGSGSSKCRAILAGDRMKFADVEHNIEDVATLATTAFEAKEFADLAYSEPFYLKEFYSTARPLTS